MPPPIALECRYEVVFIQEMVFIPYLPLIANKAVFIQMCWHILKPLKFGGWNNSTVVRTCVLLMTNPGSIFIIAYDLLSTSMLPQIKTKQKIIIFEGVYRDYIFIYSLQWL